MESCTVPGERDVLQMGERMMKLTRNRTASGNMIFVEHTTDFEFFSSTSAGAIQGYGYTFHAGKSSAVPF